MSTRRTLLALALAASGAAAACDDPVGVGAPEPVANLEIPLAPPTLQPGDSVALHAVARGRDGGVLVGRSVAWSSADTLVASVSAGGVVRAREPGQTRIHAAAGGLGTWVNVTVAPHAVASISVVGGPPALTVGQALQLQAVLRAASGAVLEGRPVSWSTGDARVATVSPTGLVLAAGPGSTWIAAEAEGRSGQFLVSVAAPPQEPARWVVVSPNPAAVLVGSGILLYADVFGATGAQVPGARIDGWRSEDPTIATVSSTGVVRGVAPGTVRIWARSGPVEGMATVEVRPVPQGSVHSYRIRWGGPPQVSLPVDTVDWRNDAGQPVRALVYLRDATLTLRGAEGRYRQDFVADLVLEGMGILLGSTTWSQSGDVSYLWHDGSMTLTPDGGAAPAFGARGSGPGALLVEQSVKGGAVLPYEYVIFQP